MYIYPCGLRIVFLFGVQIKKYVMGYNINQTVQNIQQDSKSPRTRQDMGVSV